MQAVRLRIIIFSVALALAGCRNGNVTTVKDFPVSGEVLTSVQHDLSFVPLSTDYDIYVSGDVIFLGAGWNEDHIYYVYSLSNLKDGSKAGRRGKGPNEFISIPHELVPTPGDGSFEIYDRDSRKLKRCIFENGQFVTLEEKELEMPVGILANMLTRINDDTYLCSNDRETTELILINSHTGEHREVVEYPKFMSAQAQASERPISWVGIVNRPVAKPDGTRFALFYFNYKYFRIFDDNGKVLKEVSVDIEPYSSHSATTEGDPFMFAYDSAFASDKYIYAICRNNDRSYPDKDMPSELQVWNWDGEPVASYQLDREVIFGYITMHDMKLYSFSYLDEDQNKACINVHDLSRIPH